VGQTPKHVGSPSECLLQLTISGIKDNLFYTCLILETLGPDFDDFVYLPADGTRGCILLAWQSRTVTITDPIFTTNILTARVKIVGTTHWWISVVYGPQEDADKVEFLHELRELRPTCPGPWRVCGDFNLIDTLQTYL
jgi:hypothetical protein